MGRVCLLHLHCMFTSPHISFSPYLMEQFSVHKTAHQSKVQQLVQHLKEVASKKQSTGKRGSYKKKPWSDWDVEQRGAAAELYRSAGFPKCKLQYGSACPPESVARLHLARKSLHTTTLLGVSATFTTKIQGSPQNFPQRNSPPQI